MAFAYQAEIGLAGLEEDFDLPALSIDPDDLFLGKIRVCTDKSHPVLFVLPVPDTDDLSRESILPDFDINGEKVLAAAAALLADAEDLTDIKQDIVSMMTGRYGIL